MRCPSCGKTFDRKIGYCSNCGLFAPEAEYFVNGSSVKAWEKEVGLKHSEHIAKTTVSEKKSNTPKKNTAKAIGIDLGAVNSCVAVMEGSKAVIIPNLEGYRTTPSAVGLTKEGKPVIGQAAKRQAVTNSDRTVHSVKRAMGTNCRFSLSTNKLSPQAVSAMILRKLKADAEAYLGRPVTEAVISVPACFTSAQRQATRNAGILAGLNVLSLINEPSAAAMAYGLDQTTDQKVLIYDLGGSSFDVSILNISSGIFEVLATTGDSRLGGDNFDNEIVEYLIDSFKAFYGIDLRSELLAMRRLKDAAEKAKIELSEVASSNISLPYITAGPSGPIHLDATLTGAKFNKLTDFLVQKTMELVKSALKEASLSPSDIDKILLVGGSTRIPAIQDAVRDYFGKEPFKAINPDECIAAGAAIQAALLTGDLKGRLLLDVTTYSLGVETKGGIFTKIIDQNTTIPAKTSREFSTTADGQTEVEIHVLQGESDRVSENISLGRFILSGIPPAPKGVPKIEVTFNIDANGVVDVSARDKATNREQKITLMS